MSKQNWIACLGICLASFTPCGAEEVAQAEALLESLAVNEGDCEIDDDMIDELLSMDFEDDCDEGMSDTVVFGDDECDEDEDLS